MEFLHKNVSVPSVGTKVADQASIVKPLVLAKTFTPEPDNSQKKTENKYKSVIRTFYTLGSGRRVSKSSIIPIQTPTLGPTPTPMPEKEYIRSPSWKQYECASPSTK